MKRKRHYLQGQGERGPPRKGEERITDLQPREVLFSSHPEHKKGCEHQLRLNSNDVDMKEQIHTDSWMGGGEGMTLEQPQQLQLLL